MAIIVEKGTSAASPNDLLDKLKTFIETNGWVIDNASADGPGKRLHAHHPSEAGFRVNLKSFMGDTVVAADHDLTDSEIYGIAVYGSSNYDAAHSWDKQPGYAAVGSILACGAAPIPVIDPATGLEIPPATCYCGIPLSKDSIGNYCFIMSDSPLFLYVFVEAVAGSGIYQFINIGGLVKIGAWAGGYFINASRSKYKLFTKTNDHTDFEKYELENDRPFKESVYSNLFLYGTIDATTGWMSNATNQASVQACGTGRKCSGIVDPGNANVPSYEFLLGHGMKMTVPNSGGIKYMEVDTDGALCNEFNSTSILFPMYVYALRDPMVWNKISVVGYAPNNYICNMKYLAPGGTYELDHSGQHYMTFPFSKKGYKFGYDGFAIKVD